MNNAMSNEKLLEEAKLEEKWDIKCPEFPNKIFSYKKCEFKKIGYLQKVEHVSKFLYNPCFLSCYSPENKAAKCYIAVKELRLPIDERQVNNILYEIKLLLILEQRKEKEQREINIIQLYGFSRKNERYLLYMEWMDFSLKDLYTKGIKLLIVKRALTDEIKYKLNTLIGYITVEIIDALYDLCSCETPIIHHNLKPENILLTYTGKVKMSDFCEARLGNTKTIGGSLRYRPPEAFKMMIDINENGRQKYDVFSLGVVILEYFCGMHPYEYITKNHNHLNETLLAELGELTKWSDDDSVFTKDKLIDDDNFQTLLSLSLQPVETRAIPLELQQTHFYNFYKKQNGDPRTGVATILNELKIHPEPSIVTSHQSRKFRLIYVVGFALIAILLIILATMFFNHMGNDVHSQIPKTECENVSGECINNYERGCKGIGKIIMPFSCSNHKTKCCVDAQKMAKSDSLKWKNNCSCDKDIKPAYSDCLEEIPLGTKRLEEELNTKFSQMIIVSSNVFTCNTSTSQISKRGRTITIKSNYEFIETQSAGWSSSVYEVENSVEKFIYAYLYYINNGTTSCNTGIENVIFLDEINKTSIGYTNLAPPHTIPDIKFKSPITIILNSCGSKNWGFVKNSSITIRNETIQTNDDKMDIEKSTEYPSRNLLQSQTFTDKSKNKEKEDSIEKDNNDPYKPEGVVKFEIDRFSKFMENATTIHKLISPPIYIRGLPWKIIVTPREQKNPPIGRRHGSMTLGFFLQCNGDSPDPRWSCNASGVLRVHSQTEGIDDISRVITHNFNSKENDWGYSQFMAFDILADPVNGFLKNNTIKLSAQIWADAPHGVGTTRNETLLTNDDKIDNKESQKGPLYKLKNKAKEDPIEKDNNDPYKSEGVVKFEINRFNEFIKNGSINQQLLSPPIYIRDLPWKILVILSEQKNPPFGRRPGSMALGFFLQCNGDSPDPWWSCKASAVLRVHSQTEGIDDISRVFTQTFNSKENEWGYPQFMAFDTLADPANGFLKNNTIKLSVQVWADAPHGVKTIRNETFQTNDDKMDNKESTKHKSKNKENSNEKDNDDPNKSEGVVKFEIDRFSEFMSNGPAYQLQRLSPPVYIRGLQWKISASPRPQTPLPFGRRPSAKALGFFLRCNISDISLSCNATVILRVHSQTDGIKDVTSKFTHTFISQENGHGYDQFMDCDTLADPANGFIKNDTIKLSVQVWADAPQHMSD